jgi:transcriptional regulator of NAD metabolism
LEQTLAYLRETLSNYTDEHQVSQSIYRKLKEKPYRTESEFVRELDEQEIEFLNQVLPNEINHAMDAQDYNRVQELNEVYELLF